MAAQTPETAAARPAGSDPFVVLGLAAVVLFFVAGGVVSFLNTRALSRGVGQVTHTHEVLAALDDVLSLMKDAETGQRGFLLTGDDRYLDPYTAALARVDARVGDVERLTADNPAQQARLPALRDQIGIKRRELEQTIALRRTRGFEAAREVVVSDRGKAAMDAIRAQVGVLEDAERTLRAERMAAMETSYRMAVGTGVAAAALGVLLSAAVARLVRRAVLARQRQQWVLAGEGGLGAALLGDKTLDDLGDAALKFLAEYLGAHAGALFVRDGGEFRRASTYGVPPGGVPDRFAAGDGLLGQAAKDGRAFLLHDVPDGYLAVGSALGRATPRHLAVVPAAADRVVNAVLELGFVHPPAGAAAELLDRAAGPVGVAVRSAAERTRVQNLLEETQRQAEELQAQGEELRVSNEELEEQGRALKESQARLEQQQAELEQTNVQLEERSQLLETQRDQVGRARAALEVKARELEQASRYKSDFLANMSHELRTPLNSSLILAKLLADNPSGNLTAEQVQYADTIRSAGNDLLTLINDILDLAKIEAGHMDVRPEPVRPEELAAGLRRTFEPLAAAKGLRFAARAAPGCPAEVLTDRQRLEQVLKNLLANAVKFTEAGEVELVMAAAPGGRVALAVRDTGIGIPEDQREVVFEAFRQADGTTNRRYGGTGLGLSISRELTRLLGGELGLESAPGRGSTFTVTIPERYDPALVRTRAAPPPAAGPAPVRVAGAGSATPQASPSPLEGESRPAPAGRGEGTSGAAGWATATSPHPLPFGELPSPSRGEGDGPRGIAVRPRRVPDDREVLTGGRRVILVVEDDEPFARILYDLARELGFQCLIAATAEEAVAVAVQHRPGAVVLDVGLPDHSGLSVLDRLKHDARTRHIPVHVVSGGDYAETALALGAVGYMLKPVKRDELADALRGLESRLARRVRRVLVVEDDPVQRDSLRKLLGSQEVETAGAATAAECLDRLRAETFDCMVLDLSLPDASGYSLLETLSREDAYSFPPVIVYTGRDLSADDEQRLRRYSKSVIIKGAKSPERLLDEVTLFLHQVVAELPPEQQKMLEKARSRDAALEGRRVLVVEDDVRNVFALTSVLEPRGAVVEIARNGREALAALEKARGTDRAVDLVLMDVMMPEMDGLTATREIRKRPEWKKLPVIMLTAKAMKDDQENCLAAGANDYLAKPLDVDKLLSLVRVWMPR